MFSHIDLNGLSKSSLFGYAKDIPFFKGKKKLTFKPGLNILIGPNGSGKSTVLRMLAHGTLCFQGGVSALTEGLVYSDVKLSGRSLTGGGGPVDLLGLKIHHDGQPVVFCDPRKAVGLDMGAFDDDFFSKGLDEVVNGQHRSHGQSAISRLSHALGVLENKAAFPKEVLRKIQKSQVNDLWCQGIDLLEKRMEPSIERGQPSVLLDEPEANFSLVWQARLWKRLADKALAQDFQIIVATHSAFALGIEHAHYIDVVPGFRQEAEKVLQERFGVG